MTIAGAERFGLAQLHQLRGRIARGPFPGYCCVLLDTPTDEAKERLQWFADTTDGFALAELDLRRARRGRLVRHPATWLAYVPRRRPGARREAGSLKPDLMPQALVAADPGLPLRTTPRCAAGCSCDTAKPWTSAMWANAMSAFAHGLRRHWLCQCSSLLDRSRQEFKMALAEPVALHEQVFRHSPTV